MSNKAHKHAAMIKAKADNMDLVVFRKHYDGEWLVMSNQDEIAIKQNGTYFLCLPKHNDNGQCLHWLNGGDVESSWKRGDFYDYRVKVHQMEWNENRDWMKDFVKFRIKPRKEKRWILVHNLAAKSEVCFSESVADSCLQELMFEGYQKFEVEVEV